MRKLIIVFLSLALLAAVSAIPAYAQAPPGIPHAFYGDVEIDNNPAPDGIEVSATVDTGSSIEGIELQNPVTTEGGSYGITSLRLLVQGDIPNGAIITFYVNGVEAEGQTDTFVAGGGPTLRDLEVTIAAPPTVDGVGVPTYYLTSNLFGIEVRFRIDSDGKILKTIEATSADGRLTITIPKGTIALDKYGKRLKSLPTAVDLSPPDPPEDAHIIGLAYDFGPDGATFNPAITLTWSYDPADIPEGVAEEDLVLAYYDEVADKWVELDCVVDTEENTITAAVKHFTTFAIIGAVTPPEEEEVVVPAPAEFLVSNLTVKPAEVQPKEAVTITVSVANTGGTEGSYSVVLKINGVKEAEKRVTIAAGESQDVSFTVTKEEAGSYGVTVDGWSGSFTVVAPPVPTPTPTPAPLVKPPINWPLIGGIIAAGVVVAGLLIFFLVVRRRA